MNDLGEMIRKYRKEMNLTQGKMAHLLGVTQSMISQIEKGKTVPALSLYLDILKQLQTLNGEQHRNIPAEPPSEEDPCCFEVEDALYELEMLLKQNALQLTLQQVKKHREDPLFQNPVHQLQLSIYEARVLRNQHQFVNALSICRSILSSPKKVGTRLDLGQVYYIQGDCLLEQGFEIKRSVSLFDHNTMIHRPSEASRALFRESLKSYQEAFQLVKYYHTYHPILQAICLGLSMCYYELGNHSAAKSYQKKCAELLHRNETVHAQAKGFYYLLRSQDEHIQKRPNRRKIIEELEKGRECFSKGNVVWYSIMSEMEIALAYHALGEKEKATEHAWNCHHLGEEYPHLVPPSYQKYFENLGLPKINTPVV
ncbi:helix-turn-helix domain-containing protein [Cytobacillus sp. FJAT-54145]|uniref:Helix-turn-helix domain-containing protein n=1 Tax=Cytobacillus spartinae TaxID=3299023 RepID=A0ABW6K9Q0_9BACI